MFLGLDSFKRCEGFHHLRSHSNISPLLDSSGSVSISQFDLQRQGYIDALIDPTIQSLIASRRGDVAVSLAVAFLVAGPEACLLCAQFFPGNSLRTRRIAPHLQKQIIVALFSSARSIGSATCISCGIDLAVQEIMNNAFPSSRPIINVSGDGRQNANGTGGSIDACDSAFSCLFFSQS